MVRSHYIHTYVLQTLQHFIYVSLHMVLGYIYHGPAPVDQSWVLWESLCIDFVCGIKSSVVVLRPDLGSAYLEVSWGDHSRTYQQNTKRRSPLYLLVAAIEPTPSIFNTRNQQIGETIDQYVTDLRNKANTCEYGNLTDSLIKDRLVCGITSDKPQDYSNNQASH